MPWYYTSEREYPDFLCIINLTVQGADFWDKTNTWFNEQIYPLEILHCTWMLVYWCTLQTAYIECRKYWVQQIYRYHAVYYKQQVRGRYHCACAYIHWLVYRLVTHTTLPVCYRGTWAVWEWLQCQFRTQRHIHDSPKSDREIKIIVNTLQVRINSHTDVHEHMHNCTPSSWRYPPPSPLWQRPSPLTRNFLMSW